MWNVISGGSSPSGELGVGNWKGDVVFVEWSIFFGGRIGIEG